MAIKKILLDTNAYSGLMQGNPEVLAILQHADWIALSVVSLGELIGGFAFGTRYHENLKQLNTFLENSRVHVLPSDETTATFYGHLYTLLRKKGKPIPTNDLWIAAIALQHGCKFCSFDAHFNIVDGLLIVTTLTDFLL